MISVCMATYNGEKYIKEQMDSILYQINKNDEVIVSDDGSEDATLEILQAYNDPRIKIIFNQGIHGYVHNFENALLKAAGDYIFLSDQDDIWLPDKVRTMLPFLNKDNLVISDGFITSENLCIQRRISQWRTYKKGYLRNLYKSVFLGTTFAFTKNIKNYCLPIPESIKGIGHDGWIGFLCELRFNVVYIEKPLILYRRLKTSVSHTLSPFLMIRSRAIFFVETLRRFLKNKKNAQIYSSNR